MIVIVADQNKKFVTMTYVVILPSDIYLKKGLSAIVRMTPTRRVIRYYRIQKDKMSSDLFSRPR